MRHTKTEVIHIPNDEVNCGFCCYSLKKWIMPWCLAVLMGVILLLGLVFVNGLLIVGFSYAVNGLVYNMSTGCLYNETADCMRPQLTFYAGTPLSHLCTWAISLSLVELALLGILLLIGHIVVQRCRGMYSDYYLSIVHAMPSTQSHRDDDDELSVELSEDESL